MAKHSCRHWNGDQMCVVDTETTGLDPMIHEIFQLCVLPLDINYNPRTDVIPFNVFIKPQCPENWDQEACKLHKDKLEKLSKYGLESEMAKELFLEWVDKLGLPYNKFGSRRRRIIPLGHNYGFDKAFIYQWLGEDLYAEVFDHNYRDTFILTNYMNDRWDSFGEDRVPFSKGHLAWVAAQFEIKGTQYHDALEDCKVTAEIYKKMQTVYIPNMRGQINAPRCDPR